MLMQRDETSRYDDVSLVSHISTTYTPEQRDDVLERFSRAMIKGLRPRSNYSAANDSSCQHFLPHLELALKTFTETINLDLSDKAQLKARKMIRHLRRQIARKLQDTVLDIDQVTKTSHTPLNVLDNDEEQMHYADKVSQWYIADQSLPQQVEILGTVLDQRQARFRTNSESNILSSPTMTDTATESNGSEAPNIDKISLYGVGINAADIMKEFTEQSAFENLVRRTEQLLEQYHGQKMLLIRQQTSLSLRRHSFFFRENRSAFRAVFIINWKLKDFLKNNYEDGIRQKLGSVLAVTGTIENARLCSVGEYFKWSWPYHSVQLLKAIEEKLINSDNGPQQRHRELEVRQQQNVSLS